MPDDAVWDALVRKMHIVGITGGTGCGKTTALMELERQGALVIDCDAVYHELLASNTAMLAEINARFPGTIENGTLQRKRLGAVVFADAAALDDLNAITHRYVRAEVRARLRAWARQGGTVAAIDAIALIESGLAELCTVTIGVTAPREVRIERLIAREGVTRDYAEARIDAQKPNEWFAQHCSYVLDNGGTLAAFSAPLPSTDTGGALMSEDKELKQWKEKLFYQPKNGYDRIDAEQTGEIFAYAEGYKQFLDAARTEREAVKEAIRMAEAEGFVPYTFGMELQPGSKVYVNNRGKALMLAVLGQQPLDHGCVIAGAHIDSPRLDLKQTPMYEDSELAYFKTHYYGGIKKYQWVTIPLELHGTVALKDGSTVDIAIGREPDEPQFVITDLLPHLGKDQMRKTMEEGGVQFCDNPDIDSFKKKLDIPAYYTRYASEAWYDQSLVDTIYNYGNK